MALNRLTKKQVSEMIEARSGVPDIPRSVVDQFVERTDGVPLFIEEFTSMIVDKAGKDGLKDFSIDEIPTTLQDLLLARLDRMASNVELVQLAAAIGREFRYELIAAVAELQDDELPAELGLLVSSELLNQRRRPPRTRYTFKHALIQDAAYDSMVRRTRQEIHRKIGDSLEALFPDITDPHPELVAHHLTEAGEPDRAIGYWERAGEDALAKYAHQEAIGHFMNGLRVLQDLEPSPQRDERELSMRTALGVPLQAILGYTAPEVEDNYNRAHQLCADSPDAFPVLYGLFRYDMLQAKYPKAIELGEQLVRLATVSRRPADIVAANRAIGGPLVYQGHHLRAIPHLEAVIAVEATTDLRSEFYSFDVVDPWITSLSYLSWAKWLLGYPDQAAELSREAVETAESLAHPFSIALGVSFSQWLDQFNRDFEATRAAADRALELSEEHGFAFWIGYLRPALDRPNLTVITNAEIHRLVLEGNRCINIEYEKDGSLTTQRADSEVILSAGVFGSPKLLMLSGIGREGDLRELGIDVVHHLSGVGQNLQDHPLCAGINYECKIPLPAPRNNGAESTMWWKSRSGLIGPDIQPVILEFPFATLETAVNLPNDNCYAIAPSVVRVASRGAMTLMSNNPKDDPLIDVNDMACDADVNAMLAAIELCREMGASDAFADLRKSEIMPGPLNRDDMINFVRNGDTTYFHPTSTCKMGIDAESVVDPELRVYGIENLRVADASIMPTVTSGNTNAPSIMIGEKCADFISAS